VSAPSLTLKNLSEYVEDADLPVDDIGLDATGVESGDAVDVSSFVLRQQGNLTFDR
jgi:hypothetical protein